MPTRESGTPRSRVRVSAPMSDSRARRACGRRSGAGTSATRCRGTARGSTGSCCSARRSRAGRSRATCWRRCAEGRLEIGPHALFEPGVWLTAPRAGADPHRRRDVPQPRRDGRGGRARRDRRALHARQRLLRDRRQPPLRRPGQAVPWQGFTTKGPTRIGDNVWCGANVVVTSGVTIGERGVIGANSRRHDATSRRTRSPPARRRACCATIEYPGAPPRPRRLGLRRRSATIAVHDARRRSRAAPTTPRARGRRRRCAGRGAARRRARRRGSRARTRG